MALIDRIVVAALGGMTPLPAFDWVGLELTDTLLTGSTIDDAATDDRAASPLPPGIDHADAEWDVDDAAFRASFCSPAAEASFCSPAASPSSFAEPCHKKQRCTAAPPPRCAAAAAYSTAHRLLHFQSDDDGTTIRSYDDDTTASSPPYGLLGLSNSDERPLF